MAYSTNPITVERMLPYLEPLRGGNEVKYKAPGRARWLAYRIREALAVAKLHPERFPDFAALGDTLRVLVRGFDEVHVVHKQRIEVEALPQWAESPAPAARAEAVVREVISPEVIVQEWVREGRGGDKLYFPNADLDREALLQLHEWAQEAGVLLFENLGALTLMPLAGNEELREFTWDPTEGLDG
jgi:hypothetical protein